MSSLPSLSASPSLRRSSRIFAHPSRYDEEQLSLQLQQQEERGLHRALQESLQLDVGDSTDEDASPVQSEGEEEKLDEKAPAQDSDTGWKTAVQTITIRPFTTPFGASGLRRSTQSPLDFFLLFLPLSLIQHIATCTNEYAISKHAQEWEPTNTSELYFFIGLLIYMGIDHLPRLPMYWSSLYTHTFISNAMSRDRFQQLLRYFYVSTQQEQQQNTDRLRKVRWFSQQLQQLFSSHYIPSQVLTVDEAMVGFKGRSELKQYIPQKPTKWGFKVWCLVSNSYLLSFQVYEGKLQSHSSQSTADVVLSLTSPYQHRSHIVYLDRHFTSPSLLDELATKGFRACGTVRKDRVGLPPSFESVASKMKKGELKYWQKGELGALVWKDRRAVYMLTTHRSPAEITYVNRNNTSEQTPIPTAILDYNKHKGGVDTIDQLRQSYAIGRKSKKWWPQLVWWLMDMCIINAYSLYQRKQQVQISQLEFRQQLMQQLVEQYKQERSRIGRPPHSPQQAQPQEHWPEKVEERGDCVYCREHENQRARVRTRCKGCGVYLCIDPCFELHHTHR
jgi:hypothetical protein